MKLHVGLRTLVVGLLLAVAVAGGVVVVTDHGSPSVSDGGSGRLTASQAQCRGLKHRDVRGLEPTYTHKLLSRFANSDRLCHGIWLPEPRRYFVPQGLAISGRTAWVSGFRFREGYGERPCQLVRVDLVTGRRLGFHSSLYGRVGQRPLTYCRHGGGIMQRGRWLWIVEKNKLWLVDPAQRRTSLTAQRVWRIESPARGSAIVADRTRIGLVPYSTRGRPRIYWYSIRDLIRPGVLDLGLRSAGRSRLGAVASTRVPRLTQGATLDSRGRLYLTRSHLSCSELVTPFGRRMGFVPGAEGIEFAAGGRRLWGVSESGAWPYSRSRKPMTPAVSSFEFPRLMSGQRAACRFPAY